MMKPIKILALALGLSSCTVARPFSRPPAPPPLPDETVVVVVTHAELWDDRREAFDDYTSLLVDALDEGRFEGLIGFSVRKELLGDRVWTMSVWSDEAAIESFTRSPLHRAAMARAGRAIKSMRLRRLRARPEEIPLSWERALAALEAPEGAEK